MNNTNKDDLPSSSSSSDYYAVLNIPRNASEDDIRRAYRRSCLLFHPDKLVASHFPNESSLEGFHDFVNRTSPNPSLLDAFPVIQRAYDVLINPEKRIIYDTMGEGGIITLEQLQQQQLGSDHPDIWTVGFPLRQSADLAWYLNYEQQKREKLISDADIVTKSQINLYVNAIHTVGIDSEMLRLQESMKFLYSDAIPSIYQASIGQTIEKRFSSSPLVLTLISRINAQRLKPKLLRQVDEAESLLSLACQATYPCKNIIYTPTFALTGGCTEKTAYLSPAINCIFSDRIIARVSTSVMHHHVPFRKGQQHFLQSLLLLNHRIGLEYIFASNLQVTGQLAFGSSSSLDLGFRWAGRIGKTTYTDFKEHSTETDTVVGLDDTFVMSNLSLSPQSGISSSIKVKHSLNENVSVASTLEISNFSLAQVNFTGKRKISDRSSLSLGLHISHHGISIVFGASRNQFKFLIPVLLSRSYLTEDGSWFSREALLSSIFFGSVAYLLDEYLIKPLLLTPSKSQTDIYRMAREEELVKKQLTALHIQCHLFKTAVDIAQRQYLKRGLIIIRALYGPKSKMKYLSVREKPDTHQISKIYQDSFTDAFVNGQIVNVTIPLQAMISEEDGLLILAAESSKAHLLGFYDPCPLRDKHLRVDYLFNDSIHTIVIEDTAPLRLPII